MVYNENIMFKKWINLCNQDILWRKLKINILQCAGGEVLVNALKCPLDDIMGTKN